MRPAKRLSTWVAEAGDQEPEMVPLVAGVKERVCKGPALAPALAKPWTWALLAAPARPLKLMFTFRVPKAPRESSKRRVLRT